MPEGLKYSGLKRRWEALRKGWYKFSRNPVSVIGLVFVFGVAFLAMFASYVAPYVSHTARHSFCGSSRVCSTNMARAIAVSMARRDRQVAASTSHRTVPCFCPGR